jgi:serine/threonine protein kinase
MDQIVVKFLMGQILNAVAYLHAKKILHGDIKLENVLLYTASKRGGRRFTSINQDFNEDESLRNDINENYGKKKFSKKSKHYLQDMMNYEIKLIDFGCSKYFVKKNKKQKLSGIIGTSIYCSPEVVDNLYDEKCDEWSCGVLMYILLCGQPPFCGETEEEIFEKVKKCEYDFKHPAFKRVSKNCKDLIRRLLEPKKQYRIKALDALKHPFFTESFDPNSAMTENKDLTMLNQFINPIRYCSKFHEAIIAFLSVNFIPVDEENRLRALFRYMDKDGKNAITKEAMKECLKEINISISDKELQNVFDSVDDNGSGYIEYQEFIRNACDIKSLLNESNLKNAFHAISGNKETITGEDIKKFIFQDSEVDDNTLKEYFEQFGMKYGDTIIFEEFFNMIKRNRKLRHHEKKKGTKRKSSKFVFEGPVIDEEKGEEEYEEDLNVNENKKGNNIEDNYGDNEEEDEDDDNKNDKKKLTTLDKNITNNENKLKKLDDVINDN